MEKLYKYKNHILTFNDNNVNDKPIEFWDRYWQNHTQIKKNIFNEFDKIFDYLIFNPVIMRDKKRSDLKILDCGCGEGNYLEELHNQGYDAIGVDLIDCVKNKSLKFEIGDIENLKFEDSSFDVCLSLGVISYFLDIEKIFMEMNRVTKMLGYVILRFSCLNLNRKLRAHKDGIVLIDEPKGIFVCYHDIFDVIELSKKYNWELFYSLFDLNTEINIYNISNENNSFSSMFYDYDSVIMVFRKSIPISEV